MDFMKNSFIMAENIFMTRDHSCEIMCFRAVHFSFSLII